MKAAQATFDKHCVCLHRELGIILCSSFPPRTAPWGRKSENSKALYNMKLTKWCRQTQSNWDWALANMEALIAEHVYRWNYKKAWFISRSVFDWLVNNTYLLDIPPGPLTNFALSVSPSLVSNDGTSTPEEAVEIYRKYYIEYKNGIAYWKHGRPAPGWFVEGLRNYDPGLFSKREHLLKGK